MKNVIALLILLSFSTFTFTQGLINTSGDTYSKENKFIAEDFYMDGNDYFNDKEYYQALQNYLKANKILPNNAKINYKIGICYLKTNNKNNSIEFLKNSYKLNEKLTNNIHFYLGEAYQNNSEFNKSIQEFNKYKENSRNIKKISLADKHIKECILATKMIKTPIKGKVESVSEINTIYAEYSPMINSDETVMIFTSRRSNTTGKSKDFYDNKFFEDIYITTKNEGTWSTPKPLTTKINTKKHDSNVGLSADGKTLYIYRSNKRNGDIYKSSFIEGEWTKPKALPKPINSKSTESSLCISKDGTIIYFVSNRKGSLGKKDIFYCTLQHNNKWGKAINIGENINTEFDEDAIFLSPDGNTLYFSSKGHNNMGGYDIFKSKKNKQGIWNTPENIGYPINSVNDDIFFVLTSNGKKGYFTSTNKEGYNDKDIFVIDFTKEKITKHKDILAYVNGIILNNHSNIIENADISIIDSETNTLIKQLHSNDNNGEYAIHLPLNKTYKIEIKKKGYLLFSENLTLTDSVTKFNAKLKIGIPDKIATSPIITQKLYFDFDKHILKKESEEEAIRLFKLLKKHEGLIIEIAGNTDSIGSFEYNKALSEKRAKHIVNKLIKLGINKNRLLNKGYSFSEPIANNKEEEGRAKNRRVYVKVIDNNKKTKLANN